MNPNDADEKVRIECSRVAYRIELDESCAVPVFDPEKDVFSELILPNQTINEDFVRNLMEANSLRRLTLYYPCGNVDLLGREDVMKGRLLRLESFEIHTRHAGMCQAYAPAITKLCIGIVTEWDNGIFKTTAKNVEENNALFARLQHPDAVVTLKRLRSLKALYEPLLKMGYLPDDDLMQFINTEEEGFSTPDRCSDPVFHLTELQMYLNFHIENHAIDCKKWVCDFTFMYEIRGEGQDLHPYCGDARDKILQRIPVSGIHEQCAQALGTASVYF